MHIYTIIAIILLSFTMSTFAATPDQLSLKSYITDYFKNNENKKNIDLDKEIQISESKALNNNLDGVLSINPARSQQKDQLLHKTWDRQDELSASYTQNLPTGTSISVGGTKYLTNSPSTTSFYNRQVDNSYFIRLEQDLWRNGFGLNQRSNNKLSKANIASAKINHSIQTASQCNQAVTLFMNAYKDQRAYQIYKELNASSKKIFGTTKRSYQQKLTRKIDYLAAQADKLSNEQRLLSAEVQMQNSLKELSNSVSKAITKDIAIIKPKPNAVNVTGSTLSESYTKLYELSAEANKQTHLSQKNLTAPDVKLYVEGSKNDNQFTTLGGTEDLEGFNVGLNINIPINDKSLKSRSKASYYKWKKAENNRTYQIRKLKNDLQNGLEQNKKVEQQLAVLEKQNTKYKLLANEARRLLRSGRIEFNDYIQYRDLQLNNELSQIDMQKNLLLGQIATSLLINPETNLCGELTK